MGISAVQYRIMPKSPDTNFHKLKESATSELKKLGALSISTEEQPIAFGLKALIISFAYPEEKEIDNVTTALELIPEISSAEMTDYRRAIG